MSNRRRGACFAASNLRGLLELAARHADSLGPTLAWFYVARRARWLGTHGVRKDFASADQVGDVSYPGQRIYVKALLTHAEYDRRDWLKWA